MDPSAEFYRRVGFVGFGIGDAGRLLLITGIVIAALGGLVMLLGKLSVARIPGDIAFTRGNVSFVFPLAICIVVSIVLTVVVNVILGMRR